MKAEYSTTNLMRDLAKLPKRLHDREINVRLFSNDNKLEFCGQLDRYSLVKDKKGLSLYLHADQLHNIKTVQLKSLESYLEMEPERLSEQEHREVLHRIMQLVYQNAQSQLRVEEYEKRTGKKISAENYHQLPKKVKNDLDQIQANEYLLINKYAKKALGYDRI
jgi:hypothetical protein